LSKNGFEGAPDIVNIEVIIAFTKIETSICHSREGGNPGSGDGIKLFWMPASAGMT
jgi:hypothetical protein